MVAALGGPADFTEHAARYLPEAPVRRPVRATRGGWVSGMDTRDIGLLLIEPGGGRRQATDTVEARVGFTGFASVGQRVEAGDVLAQVHAGSEAGAEMACRKLAAMIRVAEAPVAASPVMLQRLED